MNQGPSVQEGLSETRQLQSKALQGDVGAQDISRYKDLTAGYQGPETLADVDTNLAAKLGATSQAGQLAATTEG